MNDAQFLIDKNYNFFTPLDFLSTILGFTLLFIIAYLRQRRNNELEYYKQEEMDNMYNVHYHYSWWIGKNVMNTDSMWFTSDEIEAFREIWQRRISAL